MATQHPAEFERIWLGGEQRRILDALEDAVLRVGGLLLLTGDVGVGKTTLANALAAELADRAIVVRLPHPCVDAPALVEMVGRGLGFDGASGSRATWVPAMRQALDDAGARNRRVLIVVDEAQNMAPDAFAELEHLLSLESAAIQPRLSVLLVGQDELLPLIETSAGSLGRFVTLRERLPALGPHEVEEFVRHRLTAGSVDGVLLTDDAMRTIQKLSGGIPRLVERLCDVALIGGPPYSPVDAAEIRERAERFGVLPGLSARQELIDAADAEEAAVEERAPSVRLQRLTRRGLMTVGVAMATMVAIYAFTSHGPRRPSAAPEKVSPGRPQNAALPTAAVVPTTAREASSPVSLAADPRPSSTPEPQTPRVKPIEPGLPAATPVAEPPKPSKGSALPRAGSPPPVPARRPAVAPPAAPSSTPSSSEPSGPSDPGAIIDWLLRSPDAR